MDINIEKVKLFLLEKEKKEKLKKIQERDKVVSLLRSLTHVWERYGIDKAYLYGSFGDITFHKHSDIDIAIEPAISYKDLLSLYSEISKYVTKEVDIRLLEELPFAGDIIKKGILIYERKNSHTKE